MPRLTYFTGLALLLVAGAFLLTDHLLALPPGVTEANVRRIKPGMPLGRVQGILGRAADWDPEPHYPSRSLFWFSSAGVIRVGVGPGGGRKRLSSTPAAPSGRPWRGPGLGFGPPVRRSWRGSAGTEAPPTPAQRGVEWKAAGAGLATRPPTGHL